MNQFFENLLVSRRQMLKSVSSGFGYLAFSSLATLAFQQQARASGLGVTGWGRQEDESTNPLSPKEPHIPARAKRVIFLCMRGAPSHVDTFDFKPDLQRDNGKPGRNRGNLMGSPWEFKQRGDSGLWISDLFPNVASMADDLCLLRGMHCDLPVHARAQTQLHTGNPQFVRPSLGSWTLYGLGTENESMPGFVSLNPPAGSSADYGNAFLPAIYQGTKVGRSASRGGSRRSANDRRNAVPNIRNPNLSLDQQRRQLELIQDLNRERLDRDDHQPEIEGVIESYELAFRMQAEMPRLLDIADESEQTLAMYGIGDNATNEFGTQCLLARRMAESGVRFIEVTSGGWDHHNNLRTRLQESCDAVDKPIAGLLADLKQRGMLEDTLVVWSGEFGRTPDGPNGNGRDHNNKGYTSWMAGAGVKGGFSYGGTDQYGYEAVDGMCHTHDWHATILHLLGLNHEMLTYRYAGRDFRLTDVAGNVLTDIIA